MVTILIVVDKRNLKNASRITHNAVKYENQKTVVI